MQAMHIIKKWLKYNFTNFDINTNLRITITIAIAMLPFFESQLRTRNYTKHFTIMVLVTNQVNSVLRLFISPFFS